MIKAILRFTPVGATVLAVPSSAYALQTLQQTPAGTEGGVSAIWIFANLSFTAMRAQNQGSLFWRVVCFIFGFPGTLLTLLLVDKGSEHAYGIDMPRRASRS